MSEPLQIEFRGRIGVITMCRGVTNAIHPNLISGLEAALDQIESESDVRGIVLTGGEKFFSIGFDLPYLLTLPEPEFASFYRSFNQFCLKLFRFRLPVVAALGGHATAGGCILALCCDYRLITEGRKLIGLNEVKLGLPVPFPADRMLHALIGTRHARQVLERGSFYEPPAALDLGLVDRIHSRQDLLPEALTIAETLAAMPGEAYSLIKSSRVEPTAQAIAAGLAEHEKTFIRCWSSSTAQPLLFDAATKF
ncbi:MAG: enoyl-CoA hydratase/isomerase family protein [Anaerolineales bacterium]